MPHSYVQTITKRLTEDWHPTYLPCLSLYAHTHTHTHAYTQTHDEHKHARTHTHT